MSIVSAKHILLVSSVSLFLSLSLSVFLLLSFSSPSPTSSTSPSRSLIVLFSSLSLLYNLIFIVIAASISLPRWLMKSFMHEGIAFMFLILGIRQTIMAFWLTMSRGERIGVRASWTILKYLQVAMRGAP